MICYGVGIFEFYKNDFVKVWCFVKVMVGFWKMDWYLDYFFYDSFNWGVFNGIVVDCGGGNGYISKSLVEVFVFLVRVSDGFVSYWFWIGLF